MKTGIVGASGLALLAVLLGTSYSQDKKLEPNPEATKLLADARAARDQWQNFPGFKGDLVVNFDGKLRKCKLEVTAKGKVELMLEDAEADAWSRRQLKSLVDHRLDNSAALDTPCAFADDNVNHPLGRAIRVLNDEFHSSYRVRDRQIIIVNRQMRDFRFTITVMENMVNEEKKFLPVSFVVNSWDLKTDALRSSETFHHTWKRVGKYDLPLSLLVVTASAGKLEARGLSIANHELLAR
jgi:hypothetical protein